MQHLLLRHAGSGTWVLWHGGIGAGALVALRIAAWEVIIVRDDVVEVGVRLS